jgi:hypothetical protein
MTDSDKDSVPILTPFMQLVAHFKFPLIVMFNGLAQTAAQTDRGAVIAAMSAAWGEIMSEASATGNIAATLAVRKKAAEMFTEALRQRVPALTTGPIPMEFVNTNKKV